MIIEKWAVIVVDIGESCDAKGHISDIFNTQKEAKQFVLDDMERFKNLSNEMSLNVNYEDMSIYTKNYMYGCEWNIQKIKISVDQ